MKRLNVETILFIVAAFLGIVLPEYGNVTELTAAFFTLVGFVAFVVALTGLSKGWINYDPEVDSKWKPKLMSAAWANVVGFIGYFTGFGIFEIFDTWYQVLISATILSGVARDMYNLDLALQIIKLFTGKQLEDNE